MEIYFAGAAIPIGIYMGLGGKSVLEAIYVGMLSWLGVGTVVGRALKIFGNRLHSREEKE